MPSIESLSSSILQEPVNLQEKTPRMATAYLVFMHYTECNRVWDGSGKENVSWEKHCANNLSTKTHR